ncbi:hypothetical protein OAB88_06365 [Winogradskyella sp.]|nr:hypothetical protein [Winogradskyella sp.]
MDFWTGIGILVVGLIGLRFITQLGKSMPILELMLFIAAAQWILGPLIEYNAPSFHYKYYMYVEQERYMGFVVPAFTVFAGAVLVGMRSIGQTHFSIERLQQFKDYGLTIFGIGVAFDLVASILPGSLAFFAAIVANFKFVGAIILFFSHDPRLKKLFYVMLVYLFLRALQAAMFHDLVLWSVFFYMFWALKFKPSMKLISLTLLVGALSLTTLQTIKMAYRLQVWNGFSGNKLELFVGLVADAVFTNGTNTNELTGELNNVRLNQGWIISAIMDEIPRRTAFLEGETITEAIGASLLPRFLNPNKKSAGGQDNFRTFTGLSLGDNTSMGISVIGEAYGNYKEFGGTIFMGFWGLFLALFWRFLYKKVQQNLLVLAFLPLIFLQVVKAETELVVVLNHLIKASIVVFGFLWAAKRFLNWDFTDVNDH